jgi:hypothetical protein
MAAQSFKPDRRLSTSYDHSAPAAASPLRCGQLAIWNGFCLPYGGSKNMKSRVELEIEAQQGDVAAIFADPYSLPRWMEEIDRIEPISGEPGRPGSVYRMVPAGETFIFVAAVLKRALPGEVQLPLDAQRVSVLATDTFVRMSDRKTKLISEEVFRFKTLFSTLAGFLAHRSIAAVHRRYMESFKRLAESHAARLASRTRATAT